MLFQVVAKLIILKFTYFSTLKVCTQYLNQDFKEINKLENPINKLTMPTKVEILNKLRSTIFGVCHGAKIYCSNKVALTISISQSWQP
jgi:hypothetical protein